MKGKSHAMIDQIRLLHANGHKIKRIASILGISKNTVRRHIRTESEAPQDCLPDDTESSIATTVDWEFALGQVALGRPVKRVYEEMAPGISYAHFARELRKRNTKPAVVKAVRLHHEPGERVQVDYCDGIPICFIDASVRSRIGPVSIKKPKVNDKRVDKSGERQRFHSSIVPAYLKRTKSIEELVPWLYLRRDIDRRLSFCVKGLAWQRCVWFIGNVSGPSQTALGVGFFRLG